MDLATLLMQLGVSLPVLIVAVLGLAFASNHAQRRPRTALLVTVSMCLLMFATIFQPITTQLAISWFQSGDRSSAALSQLLSVLAFIWNVERAASFVLLLWALFGNTATMGSPSNPISPPS